MTAKNKNEKLAVWERDYINLAISRIVIEFKYCLNIETRFQIPELVETELYSNSFVLYKDPKTLLYSNCFALLFFGCQSGNEILSEFLDHFEVSLINFLIRHFHWGSVYSFACQNCMVCPQCGLSDIESEGIFTFQTVHAGL